jgi:ubiquinone/menaquinone biosynthesis C-methylase UbiE
MLPRTLEPEVMNDQQEVDEYDNIDHQAVNAAFAEDFLTLPALGSDCLDLGTGTARIPIEICRRRDPMRIMAVDASIPMLESARLQLELAGILDRIVLVHGSAQSLIFEDAFFDGVVSNSLVHHLSDPLPMLKEAQRVLRPGGWLFIRDLCRPESAERVESLVKQHAAGESEVSKQLLRQSLHAALTIDEVVELLGELGLDSSAVTRTSDRHWTIQARKPI